MKHVKVLILAAVAAMAMMAFFGASSASATVLCKVTPEGGSATCPEGQAYVNEDVIEGTDPAALLTTNLINVTCHSETATEVNTEGSGSTTVTGTVTALNFTSCNNGCTVEVLNLPYKTEIHWATGTHNGTLTVTSGGSGEPSAHVVCFGFLDCTFGNTLFNLPINSGNPANIVAASVELKRKAGGFLCPSTSKWDAKYTSTGENTAVYVGKET